MPTFATIFVIPIFFALTSPFLLTVAIFFLLDFHFTFCFFFKFFTLSCFLAPARKVIVFLLSFGAFAASASITDDVEVTTNAAASTPQGKSGYLFASCTVQGNSPAGSVYLGRPWRQYARVYWLDCDLSDEIIPLGWDNWSDPANEETVHFGEYGSKGSGAPKASPARAGYAALNDEASAQEMRAMLAEFRADFGAEA